MIDKELELYYRNMTDMFMSEGWKQLVQDLQANAVNINSVEQTKDEADLHFRKGQLSVLANFINLEAQVKNAEEQALAAEDEDEQEDEAA